MKTSQTSFKNPRKADIWSSAIISINEKDAVKQMVINKWNDLGRRPIKPDFTLYEYKKIFSYFRRYSWLVEKEIGKEWIDKRWWQNKPEEYKKKRQKRYQKIWIKNNPKKRHKYSLNKYKKLSSIEEGRMYIRKKSLERYRTKLSKIKWCPDCNKKKIMLYSPRCRSCTMRIRNNKKNENRLSKKLLAG